MSTPVFIYIILTKNINNNRERENKMYTKIYTLTVQVYGYTFCPIIDDYFRDTDIITTERLSFTSHIEFQKALNIVKNECLNNPERNIVDYDTSTSFLGVKIDDATTFINEWT